MYSKSAESTQMLIAAGANTDVQDKDGIYLVINN